MLSRDLYNTTVLAKFDFAQLLVTNVRPFLISF